MSERGVQLVKLEQEEKRALEEAAQRRAQIIADTSFSSIYSLAHIGERRLELEQTWAAFQLCIDRAVELREQRRRLTTA